MDTSTKSLPEKRLTGDALRDWNARIAKLPAKKQRSTNPERLSHTDLAAAQERRDWALLWAHALPVVRMIVSRMGRSGAVRAEDADDDLLQEGMTIAGRALRSWKPIECAFSTHLGTRVRMDLLNYAALRGGCGIGSYKQRPVVLSMDDAEGTAGEGSPEDEETDGKSFATSLTYQGALCGHDQYDGQGYVPEGFGDPSEEAQHASDVERIQQAIAALSPEDEQLIRAVYGIDQELQHPDAYAAEKDTHRATIYRRRNKAEISLRQNLDNFRHRMYGNKETHESKQS